MRKLSAALLAGVLLAGTPGFAQQKQGAANTQPQPVLQGESATPTAPPGGIDQAGVATPSATVAAEPVSPLSPGPPAGPERAAQLSNVDLIAGGVVITAAIICAIACFSNSSTTTTSTTAVHR